MIQLLSLFKNIFFEKAEENLEKNTEQFEKLIRAFDFSKFEEEDLEKLEKKSKDKWIKKNKAWKSQKKKDEKSD